MTNRVYPVNLELTEEEWQEVDAALSTKIACLERPLHGDDEVDMEAWIATLKRVRKKVREKLDEKGVTY